MADAYNPASFESSRRGIEDKYTRGSAANAFGRFVSQQRGQRDMGDYTRDTKRQYNPLASSFNQRGLTGGGIQSGVQQGAMNRYVGDYNRNFARMGQDLSQTMQGFDQNQQYLDQTRQSALAEEELRRQRERAGMAMNIDILRQYFGGLN